jgi:KaiC/GvpD/RAD55 family RecA-like ATPase
MPKRRRDNGSDDSESDEQVDAEHEDEVLRDTLQEAVNASVEAARRRGGEERARLLAEAAAAAAKVTAEAAATRKEAEEMKRVVEQGRSALETEKASMEKAHTFQNSTIVLSVGGHRFETSRQTLTSVSGTYLASMFSGRYPLNSETLNPTPCTPNLKP